MLALPTALATRLAQLPEPLALDLYTFNTTSGGVYNWCDGPSDLTVGGVTYQSRQAAITSGDQTQTATDSDNLEVDTLDVTIVAIDAATVGGQSFDAAVLAGQLAGSRMSRTRLYLEPTTGAQLGSVLLFSGLVQQVEPDLNQVKLVVKSPLCLTGDLTLGSALSSGWVISVGCPFTLGDSLCGLTLTGQTGTITGTFGSTSVPHANSNYYLSYITCAAGSLVVGAGSLVTFTSGNLSGQTSTVRTVTSASGVLSIYLAAVIAPPWPVVGDTFRITASCAKTMAACLALGNNRFGGFPYVPDSGSTLMETST